MKKSHFLFVFLFVQLLVINAQEAKRPTVMILPSDNWCTMRFFTTTLDNQGVKTKVPNYTQAFQEDTELGQVISKIGSVLTDLGYSLKDAEQELHALASRTAEDNVTMAKNSGATLAESPLDQLKKKAKSDILIQIWWKVNKEASGKSVSFTLEAFDSYSSKRIATATGTGKPSSDIIPVQLESAVKANVAQFDKQMVSHFANMKKKGREVVLKLKRWEDWNEDLESEFNGEYLMDIVQDWLSENAVNGTFNLSDATENFANFEDVRIPLFNEKGRTVDARSFMSGLQMHLRNNYSIPSKLVIRGLGEAILILGEQ